MSTENPTQDNPTPIATISKPDGAIDTVYYGKHHVQGGFGSIRAISSLSEIKSLLDELLAFSVKAGPGIPPVNGISTEARVEAAKLWIDYFGPDGSLQQAIVETIRKITEHSF